MTTISAPVVNGRSHVSMPLGHNPYPVPPETRSISTTMGTTAMANAVKASRRTPIRMITTAIDLER